MEAWPHLDDDRMWQYFEHLRPATLDELRRRYEKWQAGRPESGEVWLNWLCRLRASAAPAGAMQATILVERRLAYIAYAFYPEHRRKGYAREACLVVLAHLRNAYAIDRVLAEMDSRNVASYRLAESLGFTRAATREHEYVYELPLRRQG